MWFALRKDFVTRAVTPESGLELNPGFESVFYCTQNWPRAGGLRNGVGLEWALQLDSESIPAESINMKLTQIKATLLVAHTKLMLTHG